jgi:sphingolipid delta-4 desaturase
MASFVFSDEKEPHRMRTGEIIKKHPEIRNLMGRNPNTIFVILGAVTIQFVLAFFLKDYPWWVALLVAYLIGAFAVHVLFVTIHEAAHNLLFRKSSLNKLAAILANTPSLMPTAISFRHYHLKHHSFQGVMELDADLPYDWEAKLIGNTAFGKAMWFLLFPVFQIFRTFRTTEIKAFDGWVFLNLAWNVAVGAAVGYFWGWNSLIFLFASFWFSIGLHPLGARWIQEHYLTGGNQETYSYYGPLNTIQFNIGYHNEHHDFPSVPWNNLPKIRSSAPEYYDTLVYHKSWTKLIIRFIFDPKLSLHSRMIRSNRGDVPLSDQSIPDRELAETM